MHLQTDVSRIWIFTPGSTAKALVGRARIRGKRCARRAVEKDLVSSALDRNFECVPHAGHEPLRVDVILLPRRNAAPGDLVDGTGAVAEEAVLLTDPRVSARFFIDLNFVTR